MAKTQNAKSSQMKEFENYRQQCIESTPWLGHVDAKVDMASPYNFFLTRIQDSRNTYDEDLTITFPELLDSSLGEIEHSLHVNFMVELDWLIAQYAISGYRNPSMTILYDSIDQIIPSHLNVKGIRVQSPYPFGHHHTKMSIFFYKDKSLRISIYTANLIESDWENRTQGVWISPHCPYLGDDVPINYGESETLFKHDILKYLNSYHLAELRRWLVRIQKANLSDIRVCLVPSIPGDVSHSSGGYKRVGKLLQDYVPPEYSTWDLIIQCSSIAFPSEINGLSGEHFVFPDEGFSYTNFAFQPHNLYMFESLGANPESWLYSELVRNLNSKDCVKPSCQVKLIYPSLENVKRSHDGLQGGGCLPYQSSTHQKQFWLRNFLFQWKSDHRHRSRAVPHIKTYSKLSPEGDKLAWFLLTSANLSKAAWGKSNAAGKVKILSYELGVLFLPCFLIEKNYFHIKTGGNVEKDKESFPMPYDIPVTPYQKEDKIFLCDKCL